MKNSQHSQGVFTLIAIIFCILGFTVPALSDPGAVVIRIILIIPMLLFLSIYLLVTSKKKLTALLGMMIAFALGIVQYKCWYSYLENNESTMSFKELEVGVGKTFVYPLTTYLLAITAFLLILYIITLKNRPKKVGGEVSSKEHKKSIEELAEEEFYMNTNSDNNSMAVADELKKFKELLDSGGISQEEFDAKKKQLLGL